MECPYCRHLNLPDDRRCQRCGRRLDRTSWRAEPPAGQPAPAVAAAAAPVIPPAVDSGPAGFPRIPPRAQTATERNAAPPSPPDRQPIRRPRIYLRTESPANPTPSVANDPILICRMRVAGSLHRFLAALLDGTVVLMGVLLFAFLFFIWAGPVEPAPSQLIPLLFTFLLSGLFYRLMFALAGRESLGMQWTRLRLVNFDGDNPTAEQHLIRVAGIVASVLPLGLGIVWALFDEERLGWHDYISGTFPTVDEDSVTPA